MSILIAGTVAIDTVKTPVAERKDQLGGSASYASIAASYFAPARLVSIVGHDFPRAFMNQLENRGICTAGIEQSEGESFRWSGEYFDDLNTRTTHSVAINVLENFRPNLPTNYRDSRVVILGNMAPQNQLDVLSQCENPDYVVADTMDLWINVARSELLEVLQKVDMLVLNDSEASEFMETKNLVAAGKKLLQLGPKHVVVKTGEHGAMLFGADGAFFRCGAYPLDAVADPTGAGDSFLGGLAGYLCSLNRPTFSFADLKSSLVHGTVMASFNCQSFSADRLLELEPSEIEARFNEFREFTSF